MEERKFLVSYSYNYNDNCYFDNAILPLKNIKDELDIPMLLKNKLKAWNTYSVKTLINFWEIR